MSAAPMSLFRAIAPGPDGDWLGQYVATRDEAAFTAIVRQYGPMVLGVCRRRLGFGPDADDAFQVTFMVLARDAGRIENRAALPGWLHRVASMTALKLKDRAVRQPQALAEHDLPGRESEPPESLASSELLQALDEEVAALPEKLRAVVLLCGLDEKTNTEAARALGCPTGTVDSRLSAARQKLAARLARRGFPLAAVALRSPAVSASLAAQTVRIATAYATGRATADALSPIADGVSTIMATTKLKLFVLAGLVAVVFGTAGFGLLLAPADEGSGQKTPAKEAKADPPKKPAIPAVPPIAGTVPVLADEAAVRAALTMPAPRIDDGLSLLELCDHLHAICGINARIDIVGLRRLRGIDDDDPNEVLDLYALYDTKLKLPITRGLTLADLLNEAAAQLRGRVGVVIRGTQVLFGPSYMPPYTPGARSNDANDAQLFVPPKVLMEQIIGEPISVAVDEKPLTEVLKQLRTLTGANIVIDNRCKDKAKLLVSGTFSDVRLLSAMTILADMCDLKPVWNNNVYYVTTPENAARIQKDVNKELFGEPPLAVPAGYVTDGVHLYTRPADLKPADAGLGGLGGAFIPPFRAVPAPAPATASPSEKK